MHGCTCARNAHAARERQRQARTCASSEPSTECDSVPAAWLRALMTHMMRATTRRRQAASETHTTTDVRPTDDAIDDDAADARTSDVDAGVRISPPRRRHRHSGPTEVAQRRLRQQTHMRTQTDDTTGDTAADTHASASPVDSGPQVSPPRRRHRPVGPVEAARRRRHQQTRTPRSPPPGTSEDVDIL